MQPCMDNVMVILDRLIATKHPPPPTHTHTPLHTVVIICMMKYLIDSGVEVLFSSAKHLFLGNSSNFRDVLLFSNNICTTLSYY